MSGEATTGTYLGAIVVDVRRRLDERTDSVGIADCQPWREQNSLVTAIDHAAQAGRLGVVAEVKRRSPSKGVIDASLDPSVLASSYVDGGAVGISVLTEPDHFGGGLDDLDAVRKVLPKTPVLRKDFMVGPPAQFGDAQLHGADVVLIIAALFPDLDVLREVVRFSLDCEFEVLLEVHDEAELDRALQTGARLIGINNRDLRSFEVDLAVTERLAPRVPADRLVVSESGISTPDDAARVRAAGAHALLVGEALVRSPDPSALVHALSEAGR